MFEIGKTYKTRDGNEAEILSLRGSREYPVLGIIRGENWDKSGRWTTNGHWWNDGFNSGFDLQIEPIVRWINIYRGCNDYYSGGVLYKSRDKVRKGSHDEVITLKLVIDPSAFDRAASEQATQADREHTDA